MQIFSFQLKWWHACHSFLFVKIALQPKVVTSPRETFRWLKWVTRCETGRTNRSKTLDELYSATALDTLFLYFWGWTVSALLMHYILQQKRCWSVKNIQMSPSLVCQGFLCEGVLIVATCCGGGRGARSGRDQWKVAEGPWSSWRARHETSIAYRFCANVTFRDSGGSLFAGSVAIQMK